MNTVALPRAPRNASPVPHLTSIHSALRRGEYGSHTYPGNCGGYLIRDLLRYFDAQLVFDPMTGSGTCKDVCTELGIPCISGDLTGGYDAADKATMPSAVRFDFVWLHPPYWRQKIYSNDPRDLSTAPTLGEQKRGRSSFRLGIQREKRAASPFPFPSFRLGIQREKRAASPFPFPLSVRGALYEAGAIVGGVLLIP